MYHAMYIQAFWFWSMRQRNQDFEYFKPRWKPTRGFVKLWLIDLVCVGLQADCEIHSFHRNITGRSSWVVELGDSIELANLTQQNRTWRSMYQYECSCGGHTHWIHYKPQLVIKHGFEVGSGIDVYTMWDKYNTYVYIPFVILSSRMGSFSYVVVKWDWRTGCPTLAHDLLTAFMP